MMKFIFAVALLGFVYYIYNNHSPFQTSVTDPHFVEIRVEAKQADIQLVGFGKMNSLADCQACAALVWAKAFKHFKKLSVDSNCRKEIADRFQKLFDNKKFSASYIAFDKGTNSERDARFIVYGVPSSYVYKECDTLTKVARENYSGKIYCVKGKVG